MARPWGVWTEQKLDVLAAYLHAFTTASKQAHATVYMDLFAGQAENVSRTTGDPVMGSAWRALETKPPFTKIMLFEKPTRAVGLEAMLRREYPERDLTVYPGDCNVNVAGALHALAGYRDAPTFAFIDQEGAEVRWTTLEQLGSHKTTRTKVELWMYFATGLLPRGLVRRDGSRNESFAEQVTAMIGTDQWCEIDEAKGRGLLSPAEARSETRNLMRWRLEKVLGYQHSLLLTLRNTRHSEMYDMIFATDHPVGRKIMEHLNRRARREQPGLLAMERLVRGDRRAEKEHGVVPLLAAADTRPSVATWDVNMELDETDPVRPPYRHPR